MKDTVTKRQSTIGVSALVALVGVGAFAGTAAAQQCGGWAAGSPMNGPLYEHAVAADASRGTVVLFGGYDGNSYLTGTWEWSNGVWVPRTPTISPAGRRLHRMVYDTVRGRVLLFGGLTSTGSIKGDTWEWNGQTGQWTMLSAGGGPPARYSHAMAYDTARGKAVVFGGLVSASLDDTWEFDSATGTWSERAPNTVPTSRHWSAMEYDPIRGRTLLFAGFSGDRLSDTWEWDGQDWTERHPIIGPPGRAYHSMAFDPGRGRIVLFGGLGEAYLSDTWEWDPTIGTAGSWLWNSILGPEVRYGHGLAYAGGAVVMVGGFNGTAYLSDTWELTPPSRANCDGSTATPVLNIADFVCFLTRYAAAQTLPAAQQVTDFANCDRSTALPVLNVADFVCFANEYAAGCQ
ncbi:MAG: kelch repeat-containing protein [Phycisphaerales bacterium]